MLSFRGGRLSGVVRRKPSLPAPFVGADDSQCLWVLISANWKDRKTGGNVGPSSRCPSSSGGRKLNELPHQFIDAVHRVLETVERDRKIGILAVIRDRLDGDGLALAKGCRHLVVCLDVNNAA